MPVKLTAVLCLISDGARLIPAALRQETSSTVLRSLAQLAAFVSPTRPLLAKEKHGRCCSPANAL